MHDKGRKRDNNGLEQSEQEASTEKRRRTDEQLQQQQQQSQNVPELPHIVESRPPREVHPSQVPVNQRIPRPPTGRYSDYFYLNDEDRTYGQTDLLHENWDYHVAVPRRDRRGPFVRLFGRYVLSVPVPRELRNFVPRQRIDMPKLEVFSMYAHFLAEVSPLMDYIDYLNRHLQEEFTNYTKGNNKRNCHLSVSSRDLSSSLISSGFRNRHPIYLPRSFINEYNQTLLQLQAYCREHRNLLRDITEYLPSYWRTTNSIELLRQLHRCIAELEEEVRREREQEEEEQTAKGSRKRKHEF